LATASIIAVLRVESVGTQTLTTCCCPTLAIHTQLTASTVPVTAPANSYIQPQHHSQLSSSPLSLAFKQYTHTHPFNGPLSGTTRVSRYQKSKNCKTNLDFTETRDSEWQWPQLGHMQVCISFQTDNHASTPPLTPGALPAAQPTASKH